MDKIDEKLALMKQAVAENKEGDGLGYLDWSELTNAEKEKFSKEFEPIGESIYMIKYEGREFVIEIYNYE
jgi:hypothetical protein